jgi:hypothetical protein
MERPRPREMQTSEAVSTMLILNGWRLLIGADRHRTKELRVEAQRCFRLAGITVGLELAAELEAIGRQFDKEADDLSARKQAIAYHMCYPGFDRQQQATYRLPQSW